MQLESQAKKQQQQCTDASTKKKVRNNTTTVINRNAVVVELEEDDSSEEDDASEDKFMKKKRGTRGCYKKKKHKLPRYQNEDVADRAAFMLDRSLEDQASTYELIEAKKKQQEYKVKLYKYYMKYGKYE